MVNRGARADPPPPTGTVMPHRIQPADFWTDALDGQVDTLTAVQLRDVAFATLAARRALDRALPPELIPGPVVDILLTLYTLAVSDTPVDDGVLGQATTVARTVSDRYIQALDRYGFVAHDTVAGRTMLTPLGMTRVETALRAIVRSQIDFSTAVARRPA